MANPVAASMARNQVVLERMRREQEAALREHYQDEVSHFDTVDRSHSGVGNRVDDEEEQLRRAIEESEEMAREQGLEPGRTQADSDDARTRARPDNTQQTEAWRHDRVHDGRVYDDEDAELQAALRASLESAPPGIHTPTPPHTFETPMHHSPLPAAASRATPLAHTEPSNVTNVDDGDDGDDDDDDLYYDDEDTATDETLSESAGPQQIEDVSMEEMRRRRLARFGGGPQI